MEKSSNLLNIFYDTISTKKQYAVEDALHWACAMGRTNIVVYLPLEIMIKLYLIII